jgi:hypothetical protein
MVANAFAAGMSWTQTPAQSGPRVVLRGYDSVAYFTDNKAVKGVPTISYEWDESRYQFSSAKNRQTFSANPDRYTPQFAGFCTAAMAKGVKVEANPEIFMVVNGKLYTFASPRARDAALADPILVIHATKNWEEKK